MSRTGARYEGYDTHAAVLEDMCSRFLNMEKRAMRVGNLLKAYNVCREKGVSVVWLFNIWPSVAMFYTDIKTVRQLA